MAQTSMAAPTEVTFATTTPGDELFQISGSRCIHNQSSSRTSNDIDEVCHIQDTRPNLTPNDQCHTYKSTSAFHTTPHHIIHYIPAVNPTVRSADTSPCASVSLKLNGINESN